MRHGRPHRILQSKLHGLLPPVPEATIVLQTPAAINNRVCYCRPVVFFRN